MHRNCYVTKIIFHLRTRILLRISHCHLQDTRVVESQRKYILNIRYAIK